MNDEKSPDVPVFNCLVIVSPRDAEGLISARAAELAGIEGRGKSEREALAQVVAQFKDFVTRRYAAGDEIPWLQPPVPAEPGEQQRFIAVHL
jgi:hypothetical protein